MYPVVAVVRRWSPGQLLHVLREVRVIRAEHRHAEHLGDQPAAQAHRAGRVNVDGIELLAIRPFQYFRQRGDGQRLICVARHGPAQ